MLGLWVATALIYPSLRRGVGWFVDKIILRRADYNNLRSEAMRIAAASQSAEETLEGTCNLLAPALTARRVFWIVAGNDTEALSQSADIESAREADSEAGASSRTRRSCAACILVPTNEPPRYALVIEELSGGRRLLSDDMALLDAMALIAARRIDALRVLHERCEQNLREQQISKLAAESELRALRAQINPHFLFNALTTIGYLIQTAPDRALSTLMRLTGLLRSVLRSSDEFVSFGEEIHLVESYLDIERERFEHRLRVTIDIQPGLGGLRIPSLIIQPLVENAIKHGIAPQREGGEVAVSARIVSEGQSLDHSLETLSVTVRDTGAGASRAEIEQGRRRGIGLNNVEQRIRACYGEAGSLSVVSERGRGTRIEVRLPVAFNETSRVAEKRRV
jgi:signal transduction histidine kinase